ncbi:MAG: AAA family ATPase [Henriciella sp.]|nr:AAA family ATPase [Henriciella sp.]
MVPASTQNDLIAAFDEARVANVVLATPPIRTHLSYVFLTADRAYKLKRAVKLPFVDFSTVEKRHAACLAELEVNRLFAEAMYLGVQPIVARGDGMYQIGGCDEEAVDWVVEMRRFDQEDQFDELLSANLLTAALIDETADMIAEAHAEAQPVYSAGHAADYRGILQGLRATEEHGAGAMGMHAASSDLFERMDTKLAQIDPLIEARRRAGSVRRTHGDLHLRNICLFEDRPTPFDALEFDARLTTTDILYDLAFLLMDLVRLNQVAAANQLMNRYWDTAGEPENAHAVMPFFLALRAVVRMAVDVEAGDLPEASIYRDLASRLLTHDKPVAIAIGGLSGSGKSTIAKRLAPLLPGALGARVLRSDVIRKQAKKIERDQRLTGAEDYSLERRHDVYEAMFAKAARTFSTGASVILDATFQHSNTRDAAGTELGAHLQGIWLDAPLALRLQRIAGRPKGVSDADETVARSQIDPERLEAGWQRIDASGSPDQVVARIQETLAPNPAPKSRV